ncbi:MAG: 4-(cytidine 5'-diphospho)-2-C-methyl-D-erythritol kinase [Eubacteriales bacterium]|nr:4-(cytidine 5'-diphospho)-2-C-methyl-D-erythritol kinase [Eubacteriales bacterium]
MEQVKLFARAKINPALDVVERLDNGYHNLKMILQTINLLDTITISKSNENKINLKTNIFWLPTDHRNLVYKTAQFFKENYNIKDGIDIKLNKKIPVSAGLAGGSTDCAATLIGIRNLFKLPISNNELFEIGKELGADVPFCLLRGTALAEGIGEKLTPIHYFPYCYIVVAKPSISVSTPTVFSSLNIHDIKERPDIEKIIYYLEKQDLENVCKNFCNVLETVTIAKYPLIGKIKETMIKKGALGSLMSGSGSSVFGVYKTKKSALLAIKELKQKYNIKDVFLTTPFNNYNY